jgi:hypothetical protein
MGSDPEQSEISAARGREITRVEMIDGAVTSLRRQQAKLGRDDVSLFAPTPARSNPTTPRSQTPARGANSFPLPDILPFSQLRPLNLTLFLLDSVMVQITILS